MEAAISDPNLYEGPYAHELRITRPLVAGAGEIAMRYHGTDLDVELKSGDEPVTVADRECSEFLVDAMTRAFPDDVIISEEGLDDPRRLEVDRVWYIDPIDGTKAFIQGGTGYCVMMGLAIQHLPVFGILYQPNHQTLLYGCQGGGAWCERGGHRQRLRCSTQQDPGEARLLSNQGGDRQLISDVFGMAPNMPLRAIGLKLAAMALGACELYANPATNCSSWDTCGPEILLEEAGGKLTDMHGHPIRYDNPRTTSLQDGIVASNGPMHDLFVARLASLFPESGQP